MPQYLFNRPQFNYIMTLFSPFAMRKSSAELIKFVVSQNCWDFSVSIRFDILFPDSILSHPFLSRVKNKALNVRSYQSILQITLTAPSVDLSSFYRDIRDKANEKFGLPYHAKIAPVISVRAAYLYDAVLVYAQAASRMLKDGGDLKDGRLLMQKYVFNNRYTSKQGFQVGGFRR